MTTGKIPLTFTTSSGLSIVLMEKATSKYVLRAVIFFSKDGILFHKWEDSSLASLRNTVRVEMSESMYSIML